MNLFKFEWKQSFKGQLVWIGTLCGTCVLFLSLYPVYLDSKEIVLKMFQGFPKELLLVFGLDADTFFAVEGFYLFTLIYLFFVGGMQATNLSIGLFSKENRCKTNDFLFSKPISRKQIFLYKILTQVSYLWITTLIITIISYITLNQVSPITINITFILSCSVAFMIIQWFFLGLGSLLGILIKKLKNVSMLALLSVFVFYGLSLLENIIDKDFLKFITPFKYFDQARLMSEYSLDMGMIGFGFMMGCVFYFIAYLMYIKQDIPAV